MLIKKEKGITLLVLVIMIIILLILASITIKIILGDNGLLSETKKSLNEWNKVSKSEEEELSKLASEMKKLRNNVNNENSEGNSEESPEKNDRTGIGIGDYIDYIPDDSSETIYPKSKLTAAITGSSKNTTDLTRQDLRWRVLRIYDDGSLDIIGSAQIGIALTNAVGYNNAVYLLNDICKSLYSRSGYEARSVNMEDIEYWIEKSKEGVSKRESYYINWTDGKIFWGDIKTYGSSSKKVYCPEISTYDVNRSDSIFDSPTNLTWAISANGTTGWTSIKVKQEGYTIGSITEENFAEGYKALAPATNDGGYLTASRTTTLSNSNAYWGLFDIGISSNGGYAIAYNAGNGAYDHRKTKI